MPNAPEELSTILKYQLIPWWESYGLERLTISEPTLRKFQAQPLPPMIQLSSKQRQSARVRKHGPRVYNNMAAVTEAFPDDAQDTCRHPILYCVIKGQADLHIADYVVHCPAGHFVLMRPGVPQPDGSQPHLEGNNRNGYCEVMHLSLLPGASSVAVWICCSGDKKHWGHTYATIKQPDIVGQFHLFMREMLDQLPDYQKIASNVLHDFLLLFLRELHSGRMQTSTQSMESNSLSTDENAMGYAMRYLETHLHQHLTSAKVAEAVFMSRSNFLRHFTRASGQSFNQYLTALRLQKASEYLSENSLSIQAVSARVGIQPAQLYRIFKTHYGLSPSEFQKTKLKQKD